MNLNHAVERFFNENEFGRLADRVSVVRHDGISLYSNISNDFETSSIGALVSGLWQAAESLSSLLSNSNKADAFRLAFDTSSDGLYILPFNFRNQSYFICAIFKDEVNPAKLKRNMRLIKENLLVFLSEFSPSEVKSDKSRNEYLFNNITDEEMDNLFSFGGM